MNGEPQRRQTLPAQADRQPDKSPQRKLVRFFERSRAQGKGKCRETKAVLKQLKKKLRGLEATQQRWKSRAQARQGDLARLQAAKRVLEEVRDMGEKKDGGKGGMARRAPRGSVASRPPAVLVGADQSGYRLRAVRGNELALCEPRAGALGRGVRAARGGAVLVYRAAVALAGGL